MKRLAAGVALLCAGAGAWADRVSTPGAIASLAHLPGMQFQYDQASDSSVLVKPGQTQITISVLPDTEPGAALRAILESVDGQQYLAAVKAETLAGMRVASVQAKLETSEWWMVLDTPTLNLFIRVQDVADAAKYRADIEKLSRSVTFAPARLPGDVIGSYTMSAGYTQSYDLSSSAFAGSAIELRADGSYSTSSYAGVSGYDASGYSEGTDARGWWQVRGNRILAFAPPETFFNYRLEVFSNGLELHGEADGPLLWTRN